MVVSMVSSDCADVDVPRESGTPLFVDRTVLANSSVTSTYTFRRVEKRMTSVSGGMLMVKHNHQVDVNYDYLPEGHYLYKGEKGPWSFHQEAIVKLLLASLPIKIFFHCNHPEGTWILRI